MAIFGYDGVDTFGIQAWDTYAHKCLFTLPVARIITKLSILCNAGEATEPMEVGIYNGLEPIVVGTIPVGTGKIRRDVEFAPTSLAAGIYGLAFKAKHSQWIVYATDGDADQTQNQTGLLAIDGLPNPFVVNAQMAWKICMYATSDALSITVTPQSASLQVGQTQTFVATTEGGVSPYVVRWIDNATGIEIGTGDTYIFEAVKVGTFEIYAQVTDAGGTVATSNITMITVSPSPPPTHTLTVDSTPIQGIPFTIERVS